MGRNKQPRKARKEREMDPIKLVMERGMSTAMINVPVTDEDGAVLGKEQRLMPRPKGVVLGPVQTMVLAKYIMQLNAILETALADEDDEEVGR
jgi:hypothetical protein